MINDYEAKNNSGIPDKNILKNMMTSEIYVDTLNCNYNICAVAIDIQDISLNIGNLDALVWDLIDRVMNVMIGVKS